MKEAKENFLLRETLLKPYATKSSDAIRIKEEKEELRPAFFHDVDRVIHALSYTRYIDKTQVYSFRNNDHISKRMVHVQLVSKIARTIGRALGLNEDLIEAIALGHDIGHTPLGHRGEAFLHEIAQRELNETFAHNIQSVRNYMEIEQNGDGLNLTIQVLDGIMCHNGEMLSEIYKPQEKTKEQFLEYYYNSFKDLNESKSCRPMTLEGCVVRISDVIAYIGRDIDDAILLHKIDRKDLPTSITEVIGSTNREIINTIILDIISESMNKPYIKLSSKVYKALKDLKEFNYKHVYKYALTTEEDNYYHKGVEALFKKYVEDIENKNTDSIIFELYLNEMNDNYLKNTHYKRQVLDFISGMTDEFLLTQIKKIETF